MKYTTVVTLFFLAGCESSSNVKNADGETPVKYVICSAGETNCFVAARFKDLPGCESYKDWSEMLCDRISIPGQITCRKDRGLSMVDDTYCIQ
jgi:hypothetical protein